MYSINEVNERLRDILGDCKLIALKKLEGLDIRNEEIVAVITKNKHVEIASIKNYQYRTDHRGIWVNRSISNCHPLAFEFLVRTLMTFNQISDDTKLKCAMEGFVICYKELEIAEEFVIDTEPFAIINPEYLKTVSMPKEYEFDNIKFSICENAPLGDHHIAVVTGLQSESFSMLNIHYAASDDAVTIAHLFNYEKLRDLDQGDVLVVYNWPNDSGVIDDNYYAMAWDYSVDNARDYYSETKIPPTSPLNRNYEFKNESFILNGDQPSPFEQFSLNPTQTTNIGSGHTESMFFYPDNGKFIMNILENKKTFEDLAADEIKHLASIFGRYMVLYLRDDISDKELKVVRDIAVGELTSEGIVWEKGSDLIAVSHFLDEERIESYTQAKNSKHLFIVRKGAGLNKLKEVIKHIYVAELLPYFALNDSLKSKIERGKTILKESLKSIHSDTSSTEEEPRYILLPKSHATIDDFQGPRLSPGEIPSPENHEYFSKFSEKELLIIGEKLKEYRKGDFHCADFMFVEAKDLANYHGDDYEYVGWSSSFVPEDHFENQSDIWTDHSGPLMENLRIVGERFREMILSDQEVTRANGAKEREFQYSLKYRDVNDTKDVPVKIIKSLDEHKDITADIGGNLLTINQLKEIIRKAELLEELDI